MSWLLSPATGVGNLGLVGDVTITGIASDEVLVWNGSAWVNKTRVEALVEPAILPQNVQNGSYTLVLTDAGQMISKQSGGAGETITIPPNAGSTTNSFDSDAFDTAAFDSDAFNFSTVTAFVAFEKGTMIAIDNSGGGTLTIAITTDTLVWATDASTGSRTLADDGFAVLIKVDDTIWKIVGEGIS